MVHNFSTWNCVDLHIHSAHSSIVKKNDYDGSDCNGKEFLDYLKNEKVDIFSITDHNSINTKLYGEIEALISTPEYCDSINYIIGVELDINDKNIHKEVFHCLCFFDTKDINLVKKCIDDIFDNLDENKRNTDDVYPDVTKIFMKMHDNNIKNIILIPHFNNKKKGIPNNIAVSHLNYLCFNAYEDSNNVKNIQKSLNIYLKAGFDNFPFAVFTDNHNIQKYPIAKDGTICSKCFMLSNIKYPFNSIKTAFEEPRLRISIDGVNGMRKKEIPDIFINKLIMNDEEFFLSPYQNTIIGKFGSGKSLLLAKIKDGELGLLNSDKYHELYKDIDSFKLCTSTLTTADSLSEIMNQSESFKQYTFFQQEVYYRDNKLNAENLSDLLKRVNIKYELKDGITFDFNKENLKKSFSEMKDAIFKADVKNNLNFEKAFDNQTYFTVDVNRIKDNLAELLEKLNDYKTEFNDITKIKLFDDVELFSEKEQNVFNDSGAIIVKKVKLINDLISTNFISNLKKLIDDYQNNYIRNDEKKGLSTYNNDLSDFCNKIKEFKKDCTMFQCVFPEKTYDLYKTKKIDPVFSEYSIVSYFDDISEYPSLIDVVIKDKKRVKDNLFQSTLKTLTSDKMFANNKEFNQNIDNYCQKCNSIFKKEKIRYDILKSNVSMLKKSAGEKSSLFIELLFKKIEDDIRQGKNIILIIDQPEDNIDNENIFVEITEKIKKIKVEYNNFQSIIVTHNANVGITADSENIIIAKEKLLDDDSKTFEYKSGCIENPEYIEEVCKILEGGIEAMRQRTTKYGINIIKKVNENEA